MIAITAPCWGSLCCLTRALFGGGPKCRLVLDIRPTEPDDGPVENDASILGEIVIPRDQLTPLGRYSLLSRRGQQMNLKPEQSRLK